MSEVTLKAISNFSYATRRLKAGETFSVSARDARILVGIKKAEHLREPGTVPAPPARVRAALIELKGAEHMKAGPVSAISTPSGRMAQPVPQPVGEPVPASAVKTDHLDPATTPRPDPAPRVTRRRRKKG